ncbi:phage terminase small subunit [Escherichia coli]|uniref:phage terminase small subunit n=1 Tax=Escherichia coli TaxID=562 RepID=UPI0002A29446|nr:phage terminase small subunit [Escherichia coli]AVV71798.1 terminase [Escherichia coli]EFH8021398.1 terminase [Escherichia coli]EFH8366508.1 terminase [Escherichia coli]EFL9441177.1 terminase [Escherichia coli]EFN9924631.1 terminase [Escherichia coli]
MITPAQQHWQNVMAQRAGRANEGVDHAARTAHEEVLYRLRLAQARLKGVQARSAKAAIKKELLPDFSGWIEGTLEADGGQQDEVIATLMVWAIDCGDLPLALRIGAYVVRHNLIMPDNFGRTAATVLTEEICNPVLTQAGADADADLSAFIEPLDTLRKIVTDQDMPDEVRAKLCKACAFARRGLSDADNMALSLKLLREAMHLNPNAGVKREIATLSRALKKADSAAEPEDASAQQAQDESSKSKKTTRKPATRKTTATQKAKRG